jgi:type II secretory pathway component GspD/PulD (secretin)
MLNRQKSVVTYVLVCLLVVSCSVTPYNEDEIIKPLQDKATPLVVERSDTYVREVTPEESVYNRRVSFSGKITLIDSIRKQLKNVNIVPGDENVELDREINVFAQNMYLKDYLAYLEAVTGYEIEYRNGVVTVSSFVRKEWNVAAFASKRRVSLKVGSTFNTESTTTGDDGNTVSSGNDNRIESQYDDDEWAILVSGAKDILNVRSKSSKAAENQLQPYVQAIRSVGTISVGGQANRVDALDNFISNLVSKGQRQVNINVQAYDVILNDNRGAGIDWANLSLLDATINGNDAGLDFGSILTSDGKSKNVVNDTNGIFRTDFSYASSDISANAVVRFLSEYGEVELLTQPNVTVRNGTYAYISTGEEFTFVGEIETKEGNDNNDRTTATLNSVRVGVTLAVTPRILGDGRIMLEIWPVISSVSGTKAYVFQGVEYEVPNIALNELSTEVITESGKPIQLGGFIRRSIEKKLQDLPWKDKVTQSLVNPLFHSEANELSRRELVLTVTPTIVEGV